jgi:glycine cleavage system aminomethyltransferase T
MGLSSSSRVSSRLPGAGPRSVAAEHAALGSELEAEVTIEYERLRCPARVVPKPFFDPERKKA